jgi:hypothetical protein
MNNSYRNIFAGLGSLNIKSSPQSSDMSSTLWSVAKYGGIVLFVAFMVLLVVHYAYTPIFSLSPGDGGVIPLGVGTSDSQLIWTDEPPPASVKSKFNNLLPCGFTLQMDLFVDRNLQISNTERVALYRSSKPVVPDTTGTKTLIQNYPESNLMVYLEKDTNDLVVSAITKNDSQTFIESAPTVLNVPLKQPFRLTIVYMQNHLEVYINGRYRGSRILKGTPLNTVAQFYAPPDAFQNTVKVMNLAYWNRALPAREIAKTPPALAEAASFKPSEEERCAT